MKRIREIDIMRVIAMLFMIVYHILYDLNNFVGLDICYYNPPLSLIGKFSALMFIFLSGISSGFSRRPLKHGVWVFVCGMLITLVTFIMYRNSFVVFGILHLLGVCLMLSTPLKKAPIWFLAILVSITAAVGWYFGSITLNTWLLLPVGIVCEEFTSLDYYPLFPYISVFIAGVIYYKIFYRNKESIFNLKAKNDIIEKLSRKSLLIYLLHQPVILGIIYVFYKKR